ncbi:MAG: MBL fold metallo-hydrolase, partial [Parvularculaceae bacterium]|nr:MBL fold metallo-hydrolase [Parvularculaceae bacterium]
MSLAIEILGCGSSRGVPGVGGPDGAGDWGSCDPNEPKNRRSRCSALIRRRSESGETRVLIDTSPDLRQQLIAARVDRLDAVLYTHDHADQTHGIDDLRPLAVFARRRIPVYLDDETSGELGRRFRYCFEPAA